MINKNRSLKNCTKFLITILIIGFLLSQKAFAERQNIIIYDSLQTQLSIADPDEMPGIYNQLAILNLDDMPGKSLGYADTAIYLAHFQNQQEDIIFGLKIKSRAYYNLGLSDSAFTLLNRAEDLCIKEGNIDSLASLFCDAGNMFMDNNEYEISARYFFKELEIKLNKVDSSGITEALHHLGLSYDHWGKYDSAMIYYNKALKIAEIIDEKERVANIENNLGNIYLSWGNYEKALNYYISSLELYEEVFDSSGISMSYNNIGIIYYDWHEWDKCLSYYEKSFMVDSLLGDEIGQAQTLNNIAILYDEKGQKDKALEVYMRSLGMAMLLEDNLQIAISASNLGSFYLEAGDFEQAEMYYKRTLEEYIIANSFTGIAETDILFGGLYSEKGEYEKAIQHYLSGLNQVKDYHLWVVIMDAYHGLAEASFLMNNYKDAYRYNEEYHRISDSLFNVETSNQLALLTNAYEIQKRDQEMELQQARMAEQKSRIRKQVISLFALSGVIILSFVFSLLLIRQYRLRMRAWNQLMDQHKEILKNRKEIIEAKEQAEESDRLKSTFLVNLSHELRTPMNGIMGFTDLLQKKSISEEQRQAYLSYIASSGNQLLKVLNDIIDISSIETGQLELEHTNCDLDEILRELFVFFEKQKKELGKESIKLILENETPGGLFNLCDRRRLNQVLFNLINNALRFTSEGSVSVGYQIIKDYTIRIHVKDTGIGIERSKFELIFDRFRQVDDSTTRQHGGSGLGLAITQELLKLMKGRIYLESEVGIGSTFFVEIPFSKLKA